jgi:hypothetical protein
MGHAAPISLGAGCFRLVPRRPRCGRGLFGGVPGAACSAEATPLWHYGVRTETPVDALYEVHEEVSRRLDQLYNARRVLIRDREWPRTATDIGELLVLMLMLVLAADAATASTRTYAEVEAQTVALTAIAHVRGDTQGVDAQREVLQAAAAGVHQSGDPSAPVDPKMVEDLLLTQLS